MSHFLSTLPINQQFMGHKGGISLPRILTEEPFKVMGRIRSSNSVVTLSRKDT